MKVSCLRGTKGYPVINTQSFASWSSKKRVHHFAFTKSLLKETLQVPLHNCVFPIGNIIVIQITGIPVGSDRPLFLANLFLALF